MGYHICHCLGCMGLYFFLFFIFTENWVQSACQPCVVYQFYFVWGESSGDILEEFSPHTGGENRIQIYIKGLNLACTLEKISQCYCSFAFPGNSYQGSMSDKYYSKSMYFLQSLEPWIGKEQKQAALMPYIIFPGQADIDPDFFSKGLDLSGIGSRTESIFVFTYLQFLFSDGFVHIFCLLLGLQFLSNFSDNLHQTYECYVV